MEGFTDWNTKHVVSAMKLYITIFTCSLLIFVFVPSSQTIYLIAASEVSEEVVQSERGEKVLKLLDQKLEEMIQEKD